MPARAARVAVVECGRRFHALAEARAPAQSCFCRKRSPPWIDLPHPRSTSTRSNRDVSPSPPLFLAGTLRPFFPDAIALLAPKPLNHLLRQSRSEGRCSSASIPCCITASRSCVPSNQPAQVASAPLRATHQRCMENALRLLIGKIYHVYLDDIIIQFDSIEQHQKNLRLVLSALQKAGLICSPKITQLFCTRRSFLGHIKSQKGIEPDPSKFEKISAWRLPEGKNSMKIGDR